MQEQGYGPDRRGRHLHRGRPYATGGIPPTSHFLVLRELVCDRMPRALRANEAVILRLDPELAIQVAGRTEHDTRLRLHDRRDRPAFSTESTLAVVRRLVRGDLTLSS